MSSLDHPSSLDLKISTGNQFQVMEMPGPWLSVFLISVDRDRDQIANIFQIIEKAREFQKNMYFMTLSFCQISLRQGDVFSTSLTPH